MTAAETKDHSGIQFIETDSGQVAIMSSDALDPIALQEALRNRLAFSVAVHSQDDPFPIMVRKNSEGNIFEAAIDLLGVEKTTSPFGVLHEKVGGIKTESSRLIICDPCHVIGGAFFETDSEDDDNMGVQDYEEACIISSKSPGHGPFLNGRGYVFAVAEGEKCFLRTEPRGSSVGMVCISLTSDI